MPIGGVIISCFPEHKEAVITNLNHIGEMEIHGADKQGNIVAVLDTTTSEDMETIIASINADENVLNVGLTYLNTEDEARRMNEGETPAKPFGFRKPLRREK